MELNDAVSDQPAGRLTRKGIATRARIVDSAAKLMFAHGVAGTSLDQVRRSAAVSGSQITHYFQDKRDLVRRVVAARRDDVRMFHSQPRLGALDTFEALQAWADACAADLGTVYCVGGCVYGSLVGELIEADDDTRADLANGYDEWLALFHSGLAAMRQRGDLRPEADPRHLAVALVAAHQGGAMLSHTTGSPEPMRAALYAAVDYVRSFAANPKNRKSVAAQNVNPPARRGSAAAHRRRDRRNATTRRNIRSTRRRSSPDEGAHGFPVPPH
jgi:TetR/AcrR family transcriptional repressor of nem operon